MHDCFNFTTELNINSSLCLAKTAIIFPCYFWVIDHCLNFFLLFDWMDISFGWVFLGFFSASWILMCLSQKKFKHPCLLWSRDIIFLLLSQFYSTNLQWVMYSQEGQCTCMCKVTIFLLWCFKFFVFYVNCTRHWYNTSWFSAVNFEFVGMVKTCGLFLKFQFLALWLSIYLVKCLLQGQFWIFSRKSVFLPVFFITVWGLSHHKFLLLLQMLLSHKCWPHIVYLGLLHGAFKRFNNDVKEFAPIWFKRTNLHFVIPWLAHVFIIFNFPSSGGMISLAIFATKYSVLS